VIVHEYLIGPVYVLSFAFGQFLKLGAEMCHFVWVIVCDLSAIRFPDLLLARTPTYAKNGVSVKGTSVLTVITLGTVLTLVARWVCTINPSENILARNKRDRLTLCEGTGARTKWSCGYDETVTRRGVLHGSVEVSNDGWSDVISPALALHDIPWLIQFKDQIDPFITGTATMTNNLAIRFEQWGNEFLKLSASKSVQFLQSL
jgi:hypothetical protein